MDPAKDVLDAQRDFWNTNFASRPEMFGEAPSDPAQRAVELLKREAKTALLELGGGQGRDTFFFARRGLKVTTLDYSEVAIETVCAKAEASGLEKFVRAMRHDAREPLPFRDETFEAVFSHMLYSMAITNAEAGRLSQEIGFTVRHTCDPHFGTGIHRGALGRAAVRLWRRGPAAFRTATRSIACYWGEEMYEVGGFIVNFFDRAKVERVSQGYEILSVDEFEEGGMPRKLFRVTLRKPLPTQARQQPGA